MYVAPGGGWGIALYLLTVLTSRCVCVCVCVTFRCVQRRRMKVGWSAEHPNPRASRPSQRTKPPRAPSPAHSSRRSPSPRPEDVVTAGVPPAAAPQPRTPVHDPPREPQREPQRESQREPQPRSPQRMFVVPLSPAAAPPRSPTHPMPPSPGFRVQGDAAHAAPRPNHGGAQLKRGAGAAEARPSTATPSPAPPQPVSSSLTSSAPPLPPVVAPTTSGPADVEDGFVVVSRDAVGMLDGRSVHSLHSVHSDGDDRASAVSDVDSVTVPEIDLSNFEPSQGLHTRAMGGVTAVLAAAGFVRAGKEAAAKRVA